MRDSRQLLRDLYRNAIRAVDPARLVSERLQRSRDGFVVTGTAVSWSGPTIVVGAGKAAPAMAEAAAAIVGSALRDGVIVGPPDVAPTIAGIRCFAGGHPLPTRNGERATRELTDLLVRQPAAAVLALISGGASSILVQPTPPVTLADKIASNAALLGSGADIQELNTVRKHLSLIKGGGLVRNARGRPLIGLLISDVIGDDVATIGSGPTVADPTTFADALAVLERYDLIQSMPASVVTLLRAGAWGGRPETLKSGEVACRDVSNFVIGSNRIALAGAAAAARLAGYDVVSAPESLQGDTASAACSWADWVGQCSDGFSRPLCVLGGGETTVRLDTNSGKGGRNQEFALACAEAFAGQPVHLLSAGTDGIDGPTDAAGAFVDGTTLARARARCLSGEASLARHDSYPFFAALGDLFQPGPTGTNVMDIKIALVRQPS